MSILIDIPEHGGITGTVNDRLRRHFDMFAAAVNGLHKAVGPTAGADEVVDRALSSVVRSFRALSMKHLLSRDVDSASGAGLKIALGSSDLPVFQELLELESDIRTLEEQRAALPPVEVLKEEMVKHVLRYRRMPRDLQYKISQRLYLDMLAEGDLFLCQNGMRFDLRQLRTVNAPNSPGYNPLVSVSWSVYDKARNQPALYFMDVEDSHEGEGLRDRDMKTKVKQALMAQSLSDLAPLTIIKGFDRDFRHLHPKRLTRLFVGPFHTGLLRERPTGTTVGKLLEGARSEGHAKRDPWLLEWTIETIVSERTEQVSDGLFKTVMREIFRLDALNPEAAGAGLTARAQRLLMSSDAYQYFVDSSLSFSGIDVLALDPAGGIIRHS